MSENDSALSDHLAQVELAEKNKDRSGDYYTSFLDETIGQITTHGASVDDVQWVGSHSQWFTWDEFAAIADFRYDPGFGIEEVSQAIVVVGTDWWMERHEYDGSEWWEFKQKPVKPDKHAVPASITRIQAESYYGWEDPLRTPYDFEEATNV